MVRGDGREVVKLIRQLLLLPSLTDKVVSGVKWNSWLRLHIEWAWIGLLRLWLDLDWDRVQ